MMAKAAARKAPKSDEQLRAEREAIDAELGTPSTPEDADRLYDAATKAIETFDRKIERARAKRLQLEAEIASRRDAAEVEAVEMNADGILQDIDRLIDADQARITDLKARRAALDQEYAIRSRRAAEAKSRKQEAAHAAVVAEMMAAEHARLVSVERFEISFRQAIQHLNASFEAAERLRQSLNRFRVERPSMSLADTSKREFVKRAAARMSGVLSTLREGADIRAGGIEWRTHFEHPATKTGWRDDEERRFAGALEAVQAFPVKDDQ